MSACFAYLSTLNAPRFYRLRPVNEDEFEYIERRHEQANSEHGDEQGFKHCEILVWEVGRTGGAKTDWLFESMQVKTTGSDDTLA